MFYEKIDLYEYFSLPRPANGQGFLTVYCRERYGDLLQKVRPAMLVIPGGAYEGVSAREGEPVAMRFLHEGFGAFMLEYTVRTPYPVPLIEGAMAMAYIRENAQKYGVDPAHVGALGFSAGGHLAGMLATLYADEPVKKALGERTIRPDAVILAYAVLTAANFTHDVTMRNITGGDPALMKKLCIADGVTADCPPAFLWHTMEDDAAPVENSLLYAEACRKAGVPFEMHIFEKGNHGISVGSIETTETRAAVEPIAHAAVWFELAALWLKQRGFFVKEG